jgi:diguanylate cyclase (GGDEF)-like protein
MSGTWPLILLDVAAVLVVTGLCLRAAEWFARDGLARWLAYAGVGTVVLTLTVALPLRWFLMAQRAQADEREAILIHEGHRREFEARLSRALDMSDDEASAFAVATRAFGELAPGTMVEVLLADSSQAHLVRSVAHEPVSSLHGCGVATPKSCPAVRNGHALHFDDGSSLDACPHLRDRGDPHCGALCVPVSIMGASVGVVHAVHRHEETLDRRQVDGLEIVAHQLGARVGLLSAMTQSQIQANTDPLTGLLNRRSLENEVRVLVRRSIPFALVLADLDHFKRLNDTFGHDTGDRALRLFARTMRRVMREGDAVARYGGEEFVLVLPELDAHEAVAVFDRVRLELEVALSDGRIPAFTVSAGVVDTTEAANVDELITLADQLLLRAKREGRNRVLHSGSDPIVIDAATPGAADADAAEAA